jgi:stearoyl-CoA desaturase (delta-9 desaturase)
VLASRPKRALGKTWIDADTLKAVISYRMQLMARYTSDVLVPLLRLERQHASEAGRRLLRRAKSVLSGETAFFSAREQQRLASLLEQYQSLKVVYQFRVALQDIWNRRTASQKELLDALQDWCEKAEAAGIEVLSRFSKHIKTYVPQEA